jgi:trimeric autotransporter adhesin
VLVGFNAQLSAATDTNEIVIGEATTGKGSNTAIIGNASITKVYIGTTASTPTMNAGGYIVPSDRRLKKDIQDSDLGLDFIEKLRPVSYRFKKGNTALRYGFIAQEIEQVLPPRLQDMVEKDDQDHGLFLVGREDDKDRTYHVDYNEIISPLVKAVQQQQQEITTDKDDNAALKQQISVLTSAIADLKKDIADLKAAHAH